MFKNSFIETDRAFCSPVKGSRADRANDRSFESPDSISPRNAHFSNMSPVAAAPFDCASNSKTSSAERTACWPEDCFMKVSPIMHSAGQKPITSLHTPDQHTASTQDTDMDIRKSPIKTRDLASPLPVFMDIDCEIELRHAPAPINDLYAANAACLETSSFCMSAEPAPRAIEFDKFSAREARDYAHRCDQKD